VSEKEHPARTAGRYVRAAGIAIRKERDRLAAESAAKRAAEEAQAAQQAAQAPAQAPPAPPRQAAPAAPAAAAPAPAKLAKKAPPAPPPNRFLDRLFWIAFVVTIGAMCLALLNIQMLADGTAQDVVRLVLGVIFLVVSTGMLLNVGHSKERILANVTKRLWGLEHPTTRMGRFMRSIAKDLLTLLGIAWLAIAVYEILTVVAN
jgi:hypothetical protein